MLYQNQGSQTQQPAEAKVEKGWVGSGDPLSSGEIAITQLHAGGKGTEGLEIRILFKVKFSDF